VDRQRGTAVALGPGKREGMAREQAFDWPSICGWPCHRSARAARAGIRQAFLRRLYSRHTGVALTPGNGFGPLVEGGFRLALGPSRRAAGCRCQFETGAGCQNALGRCVIGRLRFTAGGCSTPVIHSALASMALSWRLPWPAGVCSTERRSSINFLPPAASAPLAVVSAGGSAMAMVSGGGSALVPAAVWLERGPALAQNPATAADPGLAVAVGLGPAAGKPRTEAEIKWPNDLLLLDDGKLRVCLPPLALRSGRTAGPR